MEEDVVALGVALEDEGVVVDAMEVVVEVEAGAEVVVDAMEVEAGAVEAVE